MVKKIIGVVLLLGILLMLSGGLYIVYEDEVAVVSQLGKITKIIIDNKDKEVVYKSIADDEDMKHIQIVDKKGLHFKIPFMQTVNKYDAKYLTYQSNQARINTKDEKKLDIEMYAQFRIINPAKFQKVVKTKVAANSIMDDIVYGEVIKASNQLEFNEFFYGDVFEELLASKQAVLNDDLVNEYGIYIAGSGINRKSFPKENVGSIEKKMTSQIEKESQKLIAEGDAAYNQSTAKTDREKAEIVAAAIEESAKIKAGADAEAIRIYQDSLSKDLEFYQFIKRMEIYRNMKNTTIFVDDDNAIFDMVDGYE